MSYAYLEELGLKDLSDAVKTMVEKDGLDTSKVTDSPLQVEDVVNEVVHAINDFDFWYLEETPDTDIRFQWLPSATDSEDRSDEPIYPIIKKLVEEHLDGARSVGELSVEPNVDDITNKLTGLAEDWQDWYYDYAAGRDERDWMETKAVHNEIYNESDYGSGDLPGDSNAFDDDMNPETEDDAFNGYPALSFEVGHIELI